MINRINSARPTCNCSLKKIDDEHLRIIRKLYEKYGLRSTGSKSGDIALLRRIEIEEAERLDTPSGDFLVLSRTEVENIIKKKKEKVAEANPELFQNSIQGQKILAEQMMIYVQMQSKKIE